MDQRHIVRVIGEVERFLNRRVAAANHSDLLAAEEESIACRAGRNALAAQLLLSRNAEPFGLRTGADHNRVADILVTTVTNRAVRRTILEIDIDDGVPQHPRADMLGLRLHLLHKPRALDYVRKAGIVLDISSDSQLAAGLQALHNNRLEHGASTIDRRRIARGA